MAVPVPVPLLAEPPVALEPLVELPGPPTVPVPLLVELDAAMPEEVGAPLAAELEEAPPAQATVREEKKRIQ